MGDGNESDQRGPWLLALGALAVGVVAFGIEGCRVVRRRFRDDETATVDD